MNQSTTNFVLSITLKAAILALFTLWISTFYPVSKRAINEEFTSPMTPTQLPVKQSNQPLPFQKEGYAACSSDGLTNVLKFPQHQGKLNLHLLRILNKKLCQEKNIREICDLFHVCKNGTFVIQTCSQNLKQNCIKKKYKMPQFQLVDEDKTKYGSDVEKKPVNPHVDSCVRPYKMRTADLKCQNHPTSIECEQRCITGHTLKEGMTRKMTCVFGEYVWKPMGFEECSPINLVPAPRLSLTFIELNSFKRKTQYSLFKKSKEKLYSKKAKKGSHSKKAKKHSHARKHKKHLHARKHKKHSHSKKFLKSSSLE